MDIKTSQNRGLELFNSGYNCAQACFAAVAPDLGMSELEAIKVAAAFGGGIARTGNTCGALSGALMALGLKRAGAETSPEIKNAFYLRSQALVNAFTQKCGAVNCRDLLGCHIGAPEGMKQAQEQNLFKTVCPKLVAEASQILSEMLDEK